MQKQAPSLGRLTVMVAFALSCFGLLLFLWVAFGGPSPMKAKGYRFEIAFKEAALLAQQADVRVAGVEVGKVRLVERKTGGGNSTIATVEIEPEYAPISTDARAVLRQKGILGETYVDLTLGDKDGPRLPENGRLSNAQVGDTVELDEILSTYDEYTRMAFRTWQQDLGEGISRSGLNINDALGNLPGFVNEGADLFTVLDENRASLRALVRNTGVVFEALTEREGQLRALVENSDTVLTAIAREERAFGEVWNIFPTFLTESRKTFRRLQTFSTDTRPLLREMRPALQDLRPTLIALRDLSPDLRLLYRNLDPLLTVSKRSLPATREILDDLRPALGELGPLLSEVNPILEWLGHHSHTVTDIFANLGGATAAKGMPSSDPRATGHYLRQYGPSGAETVAIHPNRLGSNRGNTYLHPLGLLHPKVKENSILPAFDCNNTGVGEKPSTEGAQGTPACFVQGPYTFRGKSQFYPNVTRADYSLKGG